MLNVLLLLLMISQVQVYAKMKENFNKINETKTVNVKTVLFRETDSFRDCWAHRDTSLLITRFQMQMLIPSEKPNEIKILLEYLTLCLSVIVQESKNLDKLNKSILTEALSDVLGGYINSYGLPFVYKMLYEGKAKMTMIEKLIDLSENFKSRLDTNGRGWTLPVQTESFLDNVKPAKIICNAYFDFCDTLIFDGSTLSTKNRTLFESCEMFSSIPLPILDNICKPNAIALPTKGLTLTNLNQFSAAKPILTVYYRSVICCGNMIQMNSKIDCTKERANFVNKFYNWLDTVLVTLLKDNVCHPPLIGILKLKKTVNQYMRNEKHDLEISKTRSKENIRYNSRDSAVGHFIYFIISFFITGLFWSVIFSFKLISDRGQDEDEHIQAIRFHDSIIDDSPEESNTDVRTRIKFTESFANKHTEDVTALYLFECNQKHYQSEFSNDGYDTDFSATN